VQSAIQAYLRAHPGAVCVNGARAVYSDGFRRFVLQLQAHGEAGERLSIVELAELAGVPLGTLKEWVTLPHRGDASKTTPSSQAPQPPSWNVSILATVRDVHQRLILNLWPSWEGSFKAFCHMLRAEHRLRYGDTYIGTFLQALGLRHRRRRQPVEAPWSSGTFRRFYPGAHWVGDGTDMDIRWERARLVFNLEAIHDVASDATVGVAVTRTEDEEALRMAYESALETTAGQPPEALTLDNRPSNHSPGAVAATPGTVLLRSTPGRGQSKAPIEGAFGLFRQAMPPLVVDGATVQEKARQVVQLVVTAWFLGRNGKPRKRLKGKTPAEAYAEANVTPEEKARLQAWIQEQQRRQEAAQNTREARRDPARIELLKRSLEKLGISDPEGKLAVALACYSQNAITRGLATFKAKQELGTIPVGADPGRYLGGIIRQLHTRLELEATSTELLQQRLQLGDLTLEPLQDAARWLRNEVPVGQLPQVFVDRSLDSGPEVDARFWREEAAEALSGLPFDTRVTLYRTLCQRIAASFGTDRLRREDLIARLADAVAPLGVPHDGGEDQARSVVNRPVVLPSSPLSTAPAHLPLPPSPVL
jgi:transposase InsO family protein